MTEEDDKRKLLNKDFTLISDDNWGGYVYKNFGLQYNSPFVWLWINSKDYIRLLKNIKYYLLENELIFLRIPEFSFPVAVLGDILIYFNGYKSAEEADEKWKRRLQRINWNNLFIKMTINNPEDAVVFEELPYRNKIAFSKDNYTTQLQQNNQRSFDILHWLNTG